MHATQDGTLLYVALGDHFAVGGARAGLAIVDIANPRAPQVRGVWRSRERLHGASHVLVRDGFAYVAAMRAGVIVLDVRDQTRIAEVARVLPDPDFPRPRPNRIQHPNARGLTVSREHLFVAFDAGGLRALDVSNPRQPREVGRYINAKMGRKQQAFNHVVVDGTHAFVAVDYAGIEVIDISDPRAMRQIAWWNPWRAASTSNAWLGAAGHANQIAFDATSRQLFVAAGDSDLRVLDVANVTQPSLAASRGAEDDGAGSWGVALTSTHVYVAYLKTLIPFSGRWAGIRALRR